jgi:hypothetical protein
MGAQSPGTREDRDGLETGRFAGPDAHHGGPRKRAARGLRGDGHGTRRNIDGGRAWQRSGIPAPAGPGQAGAELSPVIQAIDATRAWPLTPGGQLYATVNGGATWRRIDTAAIAAGS